jgi:hypothetical protein
LPQLANFTIRAFILAKQEFIVKNSLRYGLLLWLAIALASCSAQADQNPAPVVVTPAPIDVTSIPITPDQPLSSEQFEPGSFVVVPTPAPIGADQARAVLADVYNVNIEEIQVTAVERTTFSDDCLDVKIEREVCVEEEIPGYIVTLVVDEKIHILHTTHDGSLVRVVSVKAVK